MPHATPYPFPQVSLHNVIWRNSTVNSIQNKPEARKLKFRDKARHGSSIRSMQQQIATEPFGSIGPALTAVGRECDCFWHGQTFKSMIADHLGHYVVVREWLGG